MNLHGIEFQHRNPSKEPAHVASVYAEFSHFAELCARTGANLIVRSVFYDTSSNTFHVDVNASLEGTDAEELVRQCAEASLSQAEIFGVIWHKGGGDECC